jgi:hypothetical protein
LKWTKILMQSSIEWGLGLPWAGNLWMIITFKQIGKSLDLLEFLIAKWRDLIYHRVFFCEKNGAKLANQIIIGLLMFKLSRKLFCEIWIVGIKSKSLKLFTSDKYPNTIPESCVEENFSIKLVEIMESQNSYSLE